MVLVCLIIILAPWLAKVTSLLCGRGVGLELVCDGGRTLAFRRNPKNRARQEAHTFASLQEDMLSWDRM